ncbi:hypothetical protein [Succinivibrio dextrinosolvens]|uniref:hypothetical protein n=1 Tax=Succinivibrio dextrinosolvens TaxID=83771 RepID=UPI00241E4988|nr:hypothetical protein [Succinivibrio dextrinosolvens]MBE6422180.1 hypothetical protein [Succinivibrio dextrinosolvens]
MNTKLKSISFNISPKNDDGKDVFPSYSVYEFVFNEGISALYNGKLYFYATNSLKASDLQHQIGKQININVEITDHLHAPGKDKALSQDFNFKRTVNGIISSLKFLGKTMNVTTKTDNKPAYIYEIDFNSPYEILKNRMHRYHDVAYGKLQDKLEKFLTEPQKIIYGEDINSNLPISIKYELLDSNDKKQFSALPDNVCIQIGSFSPLFALRKIITDFGLNFNIIHESKDGKQALKVFLSKGYGVNKGNGVDSEYFDKANSEKLNYDAEIICDQSDSGSPKLTSFSIDIKPLELEVVKNDNDFLVHSTTTDKIALTTQTDAKSEALKNVENKDLREKMQYKLTASHLIFIPGTVITAKNYIDSEVKLIVDKVSLHIFASANTKAFNVNEQIEPSIEETICAYELDQEKEPGSFADYENEEEIPVNKTNEVTVYATQKNIEILEAVVTDGEGSYTGEWPSPNNDPSVKEPRSGSICICAGDNTEKPSMFYALPEGQDKPVQVRLTSTMGNGDVFNMPRIGQKVLILSGNNNYYLHSFLSTKDSTVTPEVNRVKRNNALASIKTFASHTHGARVHVWNATDKSKNVGFKGCNEDESKYGLSSIVLEKNTDSNEYIRNKILGGSESSVVEALNKKDNTYAHYQDYSGNSSIKPEYLGDLKIDDCKELKEASIKERCAAIKALVEKTQKEKKTQADKVTDLQKEIDKKLQDKKIAMNESVSLTGSDKEKKEKEVEKLDNDIKTLEDKKKAEQKTLYTKNVNYNTAIAGLEAVTNEFIGEIGNPIDFTKDNIDIFKIDHEGNLEINCPKGTITINAKEIKLSSSKSTSVGGSGSISMSTPSSIKMGCAGTSFSIASSSIKASTIPFANGSLASFGSTLTLDAYEGTSLKAATVNLSGKFSASVKDGLGAGFKSSKGVASLSGSEASLTSNTFEAAIQNVIKFDEELVKELANTITVNANPKASKYEKGIIDGVLFPIANEVMGFYYETDIYHRYSLKVKDYKGGKTTVSRFLVDTCDFICDNLDLIAKAMNVVTEIAKMADEDNWFEKKGHVGKNNAQDIKYFFASLKYTLNTIALHAVLVANTWPAVKPAKVAIRGGVVSISSTTETDAVIEKIDARA